MNLSNSKKLYERALKLIPGGVNSPVRACQSVGADPLFIDRAEGCLIVDADGNRYIDYIGSWGPMILGHRHPAVVEAVTTVLKRGTSFGAPTDLEVQLAQMVIDAVPSVEIVRMVNSGTEASMSAVRLARGITQREIIIKFDGCYHGHADTLLVAAGSGVATLGIPGSPGIPESIARHTLSLPYNDVDALTQVMAEKGDAVAAIIVEPVAGNMGLVPPKKGFLEFLRQVCDRHGAILIFDEVMTGFRVAYGGAQSLYGVYPDLTCFGKIIGGGLPVGAYGGRHDLMSQVAPQGSVYQAGTLSGNPVAMAAGIATLEQIQKDGFYEALDQKAEHKNAVILDRISFYKGYFSTIFMGDTSISTNIVKADGTKPVGIKAANEIVETVLKQGKEYTGEVAFGDKTSVARYIPLKDSSGKTIGMWGIGVEKKIAVNQIASLRKAITQISILAIIVAFAMFLYLSIKMVSDINNFQVSLHTNIN